MLSKPAWLAALLFALLFTLLSPIGLHFLIRRGLAAPRVRERGNPGELGLPWQEVRFPTANGKRLGAWLIPAGAGAPALVLLHGWGSNAEMMLALAPALHRAGYSLLLVDARNHGMSDDDSYASLPRFAEDLEHAIDWLKAQPGTDPEHIGVIGHSVGAAAALLAASRRCDIRAVVSLAAFAHPEAMMRRWVSARGVPYWPLGWYILRYVERVIGHRFDAIAPCHAIRRIACPVLLMHGTDDDTVPLADAHQIFASRPHDRVELLALAGGHDECREVEIQLARMVEFLDREMRGAGSSGSSPEVSARDSGAPAEE